MKMTIGIRERVGRVLGWLAASGILTVGAPPAVAAEPVKERSIVERVEQLRAAAEQIAIPKEAVSAGGQEATSAWPNWGNWNNWNNWGNWWNV